MGFRDYRVEIDEENKKGLIFVYDNPSLVKDNLPLLVDSVNHLAQMIARKSDDSAIFIDINNYRQERENLIAELAKAAAKKVIATGENVSLPIMNSYERRLVHVTLAIHPEVITESTGEKKDRHVVIKKIRES
ncbi:MAG: R3H domain-containing nucleic acid-binding protein [bacterium]|nr:R3H domain-containing nucleic acid-binding protein [bacterium]